MEFSALNQFTDIPCQATAVKVDLCIFWSNYDAGLSGKPYYTCQQMLTQQHTIPLNLFFLAHHDPQTLVSMQVFTHMLKRDAATSALEASVGSHALHRGEVAHTPCNGGNDFSNSPSDRLHRFLD